MSGNVPGVLELADGRLSFTTEEGRVFETPVSGVSEVKFPWYYFGMGVKFKVSDIGKGRKAGKAWKSVLLPGA